MLIVGCGDSATGTGGDPANGGSGGTPPPVEGTFEVKWGPTMVPASTESTQCVVKRLGNDGPAFVNQIQNELGATSHHFIVYEVDDEVERPEPYDCFPFTGSGSSSKLLMITQKASDTLRLPSGVAYEIPAGKMIRLELHYINVGATPQMAEATSTFTSIASEGIEYRADVAFLGSPGFPSIPANDDATYGPVNVSIPGDIQNANFFAITGHQHKLGTDVFVQLLDSAREPVQQVYDVANFLWDEPETVVFDPPFTVPSGGSFELTCDWTNFTDEPVGFGTSVDNEMCFFWAYHYQ